MPAKKTSKGKTPVTSTYEVHEDINVDVPLLNTTGMVFPGNSAGTSSGTSAGTSFGPSSGDPPVCPQYVCLSVCESECEFVS